VAQVHLHVDQAPSQSRKTDKIASSDAGQPRDEGTTFHAVNCLLLAASSCGIVREKSDAIKLQRNSCVWNERSCPNIPTVPRYRSAQALEGTSKNGHRSSGTPDFTTNDSVLFSVRFCAVHPKNAGDCPALQFFEVPSSSIGQRAGSISAVVDLLRLADKGRSKNQDETRQCIEIELGLLTADSDAIDAAEQAGGSLRKPSLAPWQINRVMSFIDSNLANTIRLRDLAAITPERQAFFPSFQIDDRGVPVYPHHAASHRAS
jgi:hypothetical protein